MNITPLSQTRRDDWNRLIARTPESGFMQSWEWSLFKEAEGQQVLRLGVFDEDILVAGALVYYVDSPSGASLLEAPHGPVLPWEDEGKARRAADLILGELRSFAEEKRAPLIRIEPLIRGRLPEWMGSPVRAPLDLMPTPTLIVDLSPDEDAILASMKPKGRYNVRLAHRKGVEVSWTDNPDAVEDFYLLFELTCRRHDFHGEPKSFFFNMLRTLRPMARLYFASYRGVVLSAAIAVFFGDRATFLHGGSLPFLRSAMASYALHWRIMRDAKALGCRCYDFFGIAPPGDPDHPYARFSQFKQRFGGRVAATAGAHDYYLYPRIAALWVRKLMDIQEGPGPRRTEFNQRRYCSG